MAMIKLLRGVRAQVGSVQVLVALCGSLVTSGCIAPPSPAERLAEASINANVATRFGRMDVALENVDAKAQQKFAAKHAHWGKELRIVDLEVGGMSMLTKEHADVFVAVAWQRPSEAELRVTHVKQRWFNGKHGWKMLFEERTGGSEGLFGEVEKIEQQQTIQTPVPKQFPTRVIAGDG